MEKHLVIIGNGVAAAIISYVALQRGLRVSVIAPHHNDGFGVIGPGAKFINWSEFPQFMNLAMSNCMRSSKDIGRYQGVELGGGVTRIRKDGDRKLYTWDDIVSDRGLAIKLSYDYAKSMNRRWDRKVLFGICDMCKPPFVACTPSYNQLVAYVGVYSMRHVDFIDDTVVNISGHHVNTKGGLTIDYDQVCSTIPLSVSDFLPIPAHEMPEVHTSGPLYAKTGNGARVAETTLDTERPGIEYFIADPGVEWNIKRISHDTYAHTVEYTNRPDIEGVHQLPPNISSISESDTARLEKLLSAHDIYLLGRFAQAQSKIMLQDMFRRAEYITGKQL